MSGGQQQRVSVARALVTDPALLLADEPTGNLDSVSTNDVLGLFDELHEQGRTVVVITHEIEVGHRAVSYTQLQRIGIGQTARGDLETDAAPQSPGGRQRRRSAP